MKHNWKGSIHMNNHGSTLLTILICAAFIGILGTLMISVTMTNLEMKMVASKSKDNFYSCETAMEEIRTGLQELTADSIQTVYKQKVLVKYATYLTMTDTEVNDAIQKDVTGELMYNLVQTSETDKDKLAAAENLTANLNNFKKYLINSSFNTPELSIESISGYSNYIIIKNIQIAYTKDDYKTSITTDIKITLPKFRVGETSANDTYQLKQPFEKYVLVADGGITSDNNEEMNTITGSVYAGKSGILVHSPQGGTHEVKIQGNNIITRGDITVKDRGNLTLGVNPVSEGSAIKPIIWAKNLMTDAASEDMHPVLKINGISLIQNDMVLNGYNSEVAFTGAYVGYSDYRTQMGSAIMVNGSDSALDLSGLSSLMLRGRAGVMAGDTNGSSDILTGESVAIKSNQRAYLVPGKYIGSSTSPINHNPVSIEDINSLGGTPTVDTPSLKTAYQSYVAADTPCKAATKHIGGIGDNNDALNYYYLNFASGIKADSFMHDYYNSTPEVLNHMEPFKIQYLKLPTDSKKIKTIGNAASYSNTDSDPKKKVTLSAGLSSLLSTVYPTDSALDAVFQILKLNDSIYSVTPVDHITVGSLDNKYSKMTHLLSLENKEYADADQVVASTLYLNGSTDPTNQSLGVDYVAANDALKVSSNDNELVKIKEEEENGNVDVDYSDAAERIIVIDGNVTIKDHAVINGLLVASGDITIEDNVTINGMVISSCEKGSKYGIITGNNVNVNGRLVSCNQIKLGTNCILKLDDSAEKYIGDIFSKEGSLLQYIFKNVDVTENLTTKRSPLINMSNMITYENWRKNK